MIFKALTFVILLLSSSAIATEYIENNGEPIAINLEVGKERVIDFGTNILFKKGEAGNFLDNPFSHQGRLYLTAKNEFPIKRMQVQIVETGAIVILDVSATENKIETGNALVVSTKKFSEPTSTSNSNSESMKASVAEYQSANNAHRLGALDLLRFASQDSFAPQRLKPIDHRFSPTKVSQKLDLSELFIGQSYALYDARLIKAWFVEGSYLTVIAVRNRSKIPRQLNLFDLNVNATLATPQHVNLSARDVAGDATRIYVITKQPFENAIGAAPLVIGG
ncbi:hypothetical protein UA38_11705 [Photobacterium kishitanii]|nr:DUF3438 family protein [Photobacterium kishitanii]KJG57034.1 hypothetical protein UA38_11705 [Photobacterium kishitanii]KJG60558.1 hypothetical protein UA42_14490 [Photobacterium kishitanii]KJG64860.1 hypothetical protein UA40_14185 [Photobacterium kishitanii]KJG68496.1 hypothetical protein UA41_16595 [Photobacterium kishitanii]OBU31220.1 hypothetical protein AYY23_20115 [Photobacterium kishitanii]